jgi:3-dehydroquinate synthetase
MVVLGVCVGMVLATDFSGRIVKISPDSVTFQTFDKETKKFGDAKSYPIAKDAKFFTGKKDDKKTIEGGVRASIFKDIDAKKGISAVISVNDSKVTEIRVREKK